MSEESDSAKIARIDERTLSILNLVKSHVESDDKRFEEVNKKVAPLWDEHNENKGAFKASRFAGMGLWAIIVLAANWFIGGMHK